MRKALLVIVAALILAGCSGPEHGRIVDKEFTPSHTLFLTQCVNSSCHLVPMFIGDDWEFDLVDGDDEGWRSVDETTFHKYNVGDYYP